MVTIPVKISLVKKCPTPHVIAVITRPYVRLNTTLQAELLQEKITSME